MRNIIAFIFILVHTLSFAQKEKKFSVFFDVDKHNITSSQQKGIQYFIKTIDNKKVTSISILGYCDDRASSAYNLELSKKRANAVRQFLKNEGVKLETIVDVDVEGKGKVELTAEDLKKDINEVRRYNRRVDIVLNFKGEPIAKVGGIPTKTPVNTNDDDEEEDDDPFKIPGVYFKISKNTKTGDRIYLKNIHFPLDRSVLTNQAKVELDVIAAQLKKFSYLEIEIQGHICCTNGSREAIDIGTGREELSYNRANAVFRYLVSKRINPNRMRFKAYGNKQPLGLDEKYDKRVEFLILNDGKDKK